MSSMMQPPPGGPPPQGGGDPMGAMDGARSPFSGVDLASMAGDGTVGKGQTVRQFLGGLGIDVDGPLEQLLQFQKQAGANRQPLQKMQSIAGAQAPPGAPPGRPPMAATGPSGGGLESMRKELMG